MNDFSHSFNIRHVALRLAAAAFLCTVMSAYAFSAGQPGATSVTMLKYDTGARALAMGGAATALADDTYAIRYNPAGLAVINVSQVSAMVNKGIMDTGMNFIGGAFPLDYKGIWNRGHACMGVGLWHSGNGDMDWYSTDAGGNAVNNGTNISAGSDMILSLSYAEKSAPGTTAFSIGKHKFKTDVDNYFGATIKLINSKLPNTDGGIISGSAYALDAGWLAKLPDWNAAVGASLLNLGTNITYLTEGNPLPLTVRAGGTYKYDSTFLSGHLSGLTASLDLVNYMREQKANVLLGLETSLEKMVMTRLGYRFFRDTGGFTMGAGINYNKQISCDVALAFDGLLGDTFQLSATYRFGIEPEIKKPAAKTKSSVMLNFDKSVDFIEKPAAKPERSAKPETRSEHVERQFQRLKDMDQERISHDGTDMPKRATNTKSGKETREEFIEQLNPSSEQQTAPAKPAKKPAKQQVQSDDLTIIQ